MSTMRAKVAVFSVQEFHYGTDGGKSAETVTFNPISKDGPYGSDGTDEDNSYAKWTPSGEIRLQITNPALWGQFQNGQRFYVDFSPAPPARKG
jgi:hypothetical protein